MATILGPCHTTSVNCSTIFYQTPIDIGFRMIAILAGVRKETLRLVWGVSSTGRVSKPVPMQMSLVDDVVTRIGKQAPIDEYVIGAERRTRSYLMLSSIVSGSLQARFSFLRKALGGEEWTMK